MQTASPTPPILAAGDLAANVASCARHLRAANLSPAIQDTYLISLGRLAAFLAERGMPTDVAAIRREHLESFIEDLLARWKPATAANRYSGIRPFFAWLVEEGEIRESPMARMRKPKLPKHAPPVLTDDQLRRVLAACEGPGFEARRDTAVGAPRAHRPHRSQGGEGARPLPPTPRQTPACRAPLAVAGREGGA